ncbi:SIS domain-containing protein, partial [Candidatus Poribacteria bacterium]|nr:SIS domain-containing protein [Candidatus Poribacteria bacterium]
ISTSGNSPNVLRAVEAARARGARAIGMTGRTGGKLAELCDIALTVPSDETPRIQEAHITIGHILCGLVEQSVAECVQ